MKSILLKKLIIENFKGIKELNIDFEKVTNIYGENALGKTSIFDAFTWLMFDKDSKNRTTFDIKPLDEVNVVIRGLNPIVTGVLEVNGFEFKLAKTYKEKWTKKRGEAEKTFTGNETIYEINDVPVKKTEYQKKISEIAEEDQFKLLTNPYYFSDSLNWKEARNLILEVAGDVTTGQVIDNNKELEPLRIELEKGSVDELLKSKKASIKKLSDKKKEIPTRINECDRSVVTIDFESVDKELEVSNSLLERIELDLLNSNRVNEQTLKDRERIFEIRKQKQDIDQKAINRSSAEKFELMNQIRSSENEVNDLRMNLISLENDKKNKLFSKENIENKMGDLRSDYTERAQETLDLSIIETECPTCKREFETNDIESKKQELLSNFNLNKATVMKNIQQKGMTLKKEVESLDLLIQDLSNKITGLLSMIQEKNMSLITLREKLEGVEVKVNYTDEDNSSIEKLNNELNVLEAIINNPSETNSGELRAEKNLISSKINELNKTLAKKELNKELSIRKEQLLNEEKELGIDIAKQERVVILCEEFIKARVNMLESNINSKFESVKFKLFKEQVNGGIDETCEALVNGVPFGNANTAGQINAGLDIISTLSSHFGVEAPIFIDNRESVNELIEIDSQVINLVVTKDNPLKIEKIILEGVM